MVYVRRPHAAEASGGLVCNYLWAEHASLCRCVGSWWIARAKAVGSRVSCECCAQEAAAFFKKRALLEEEYGRGMQRLAKATSDAYSASEGKAGYVSWVLSTTSVSCVSEPS